LPHKDIAKRDGITGSFELILTQPRHDDALVWDAACASLELALTFGGVGQRSRRGYGALQIVEASNDKVRVFVTTRRGWEFHVKRVTKQAIEAVARLTIEKFPDFRWARAQNLADYPCATNAGMIRLYDWSEPTAMEAVKRFMRRTKEHRAFGGANPRQASPLWMRPIQIGNSYGLLCTVLTSDFRGANYDYLGNFLENLGGESLNVKGWNTL
jgi:CRISPR/Cas system CMR-associated protein Cmr1 (group 7 of RAMP superfamily)